VVDPGSRLALAVLRHALARRRHGLDLSVRLVRRCERLIWRLRYQVDETLWSMPDFDLEQLERLAFSVWTLEAAIGREKARRAALGVDELGAGGLQ